MIQTIIEAFDLAGGDAIGVVTRHGLAELRPVGSGTAPYVYAGDGQWTQIATDANGSWSYWRIAAPIIETSVPGSTCTNDFRATYQLRLVTVVERSVCPAVEDAARAALSAIRGTAAELARGLKLKRLNADTGRVDLESRKVYQQEFGQVGDVPPNRSIIAIEITVVALGRPECFTPCGATGSLLCQLVEVQTWAKIKACMSMVQIDAAEADLCAGGGPCDPLTVTVNDTIEYATVDDPCGATTNVEVVNEADEQVGTLVTGKIVVPTAKSLCELVTEGTSEEVAICVISSGKRPGVLAEIIPTVPEGDTVAQVYDVMTPAQQDLFDVTVQLQDSAASPIGAPDVYAAGTTTTKTAPDASWTLKDTAGNTLDSGAIASGGAADIEAPDAKVQLKDSAGNNIGSLNVYLSGSINNLTAPDGTILTTDGVTAVDVVKSNGNTSLPQTRVPYKDAANADQLTTAADTEFASGTLRPDTIIPRITIYESDGVTVQGYADIGSPFYTVDACPPSAPAFVKFIWQAGDADTYLWTVTADEAGTYGTYTPTGTNGTLTYSKNGGGYAALSGAITLAVSDTITVRRTTTTNAGSVKWEA